MKTRLLSLAVMVGMGFSAHAVTFNSPDANFIDSANSIGMTGETWETPEYVSSAMPHVYKFTHSYTLHKGQFVQELEKGKPLDLEQVQVEDFDGPLSVMDFLRNRMQNHNAVILKDGKLVHEHYGNGMDQHSPHLDMSVSKSFTAMAAAIAVDKGLLNWTDKAVRYVPELKGTAFKNASVSDISDMRTAVVLAPGTVEKYWDVRLSNAQGYYGVEASKPYPNGTLDFFPLITERQDYAMGEKYDYQDVNSELLGLIVDRATGKSFTEILEKELLQKVGVGADAYFMSDKKGLAMGSTGMNMATKDLARVGLLFLNQGKNQQGEQVLPAQFVEALWQGNEQVRSAWKKGKEAGLADGFYKDQFRLLEIGKRKILAMVGVNGQVCAMDKQSNAVITLNGAYPMAETPRFAVMQFHQLVPTILDALDRV
ncbi:serine hydrolase domain-containing protein [Paraferrimonas sedimenticola]|uniref:6-aminohexanoate-dimer hydrolase n=1 Tax=Paraferrimonas sedimenticola TaxID=375674 RepID=A0AA37RU74_9GAMM|nr:serine hydrolase [Paraferrimonas sedimenticola]GLP95595.1 6-aminohexanoate-dimer hydrolase [Paraferrimonas sedimenticola]